MTDKDTTAQRRWKRLEERHDKSQRPPEVRAMTGEKATPVPEIKSTRDVDFLCRDGKVDVGYRTGRIVYPDGSYRTLRAVTMGTMDLRP